MLWLDQPFSMILLEATKMARAKKSNRVGLVRLGMTEVCTKPSWVLLSAHLACTLLAHIACQVRTSLSILELVPFPNLQVGCKTQHLRPTCALCILHWNYTPLCCRAFYHQLLLASDLPTFVLPWLLYCPQPFVVAITVVITFAVAAATIVANNCQPPTTIHRFACRHCSGVGVVRLKDDAPSSGTTTTFDNQGWGCLSSLHDDCRQHQIHLRRCRKHPCRWDAGGSNDGEGQQATITKTTSTGGGNDDKPGLGEVSTMLMQWAREATNADKS